VEHISGHIPPFFYWVYYGVLKKKILLVNDNTGNMMFVQETRKNIHSSMQTGNI